MELEHKRKRLCASGAGGRPAAAERDQLSALPDGLLHAIMSFMKARQAVRSACCPRSGAASSAPCRASTWTWKTSSIMPRRRRRLKATETTRRRRRCRASKSSRSTSCSAATWRRWTRSGLASARTERRTLPTSAPPAGSAAPCYTAPLDAGDGTGPSSSSSYWRMERLHLCNVVLDSRLVVHVTYFVLP